MLLSALLALSGTLIYGASDFFGGLAARRMSALWVTAVNSCVGVVLVGIFALFVPTQWSPLALFWGALAGAAGTLALVLLYACLAIGPMSILAPIMALVSAVFPIAVGFARGERLSGFGYAGLVMGLVAVLLICFVPGARVVRPSGRGVLLAVGAGIGVGGYLIFMDLTPVHSGPAPLVVTFAVTGVIVGLILLLQRARRALRSQTREPGAHGVVGRPLQFAILCGATDAVAATLFLLALRSGQLSVVSVLSALSPAGTIILAAIVLRERIAIVQWLGLAVALGAAALLALA
jgi:drug/metabolite transporter (DMT)-like permease